MGDYRSIAIPLSIGYVALKHWLILMLLLNDICSTERPTQMKERIFGIDYKLSITENRYLLELRSLGNINRCQDSLTFSDFGGSIISLYQLLTI